MEKDFTVKRLEENDVKPAMELVLRVFMEFEAPGYPKEGIETFKNFIDCDTMKKKINAEEIIAWGCFDSEKILGVIAFRSGLKHIALLFVDKDYHKQGIAKRLFQTALLIIQQKGTTEVTVNSSPYAVKIYEKMGFTAVDCEQCSDGIVYTPMKLSLASLR